MSKEMQIEEIAKALNEATFGVNTHTLADHLKPETISKVSEYLYNAGYRKQSEVAREIFEEIYKLLFSSFTAVMPCNSRLVSLNELAELKKKYTGEK